MDVLGRWVNIVICILCLTIVPMGSRTSLWREELEAYLIAKTDLLKYKIQKKGALTLEDYLDYQSIFESLDGDYDFGIVIARRYVMPVDDILWQEEDFEETGLFATAEEKIVFQQEYQDIAWPVTVADFQETEEQVCEYGHSYFGEEECCPYCALTIAWIEIVPLRLDYQLREELELEVILHYQDGREETTEEWVSSFLPDQPGEQQVTVFCQGLKASITVYVEQEREVCPFCDGFISISEFVCPECYYTPVGIWAEGTAEYGKDPEVKVKLIFRDGHYQVIEEGFSVNGFSPYKEGVQEVEIRYQEFSCLISLEIEIPEKILIKEEEEELFIAEPEAPMLKLMYRREIEEELEINELIILENESFFNIFVEKCNVMSKKSVINYRGLWKEEAFHYTTGGEAK